MTDKESVPLQTAIDNAKLLIESGCKNMDEIDSHLQNIATVAYVEGHQAKVEQTESEAVKKLVMLKTDIFNLLSKR